MRRTILSFSLLFLGSISFLHAQAALNTSGGMVSFSNGNFVEYSVGEVATATVGSAGNEKYTVAGVIQPNYHIVVVGAANESFDRQYHFLAYPNPASSQLNIETDYTGFVNYVFTNVLGQQLASGKFEYTPLDISGLPAGTFFLRLSSDDNLNFKSIKIIKQ